MEHGMELQRCIIKPVHQLNFYSVAMLLVEGIYGYFIRICAFILIHQPDNGRVFITAPGESN